MLRGWEWLELSRRVLSEMMEIFFIIMVVMQVHTFIKPIFLRPVHFTVCKFYLHWDSNQHCSSLHIPFPNKSIQTLQKLPLHQKAFVDSAGFHGALHLSSLKCTMCFSFISLKMASFLWTWIAFRHKWQYSGHVT